MKNRNGLILLGVGVLAVWAISSVKKTATDVKNSAKELLPWGGPSSEDLRADQDFKNANALTSDFGAKILAAFRAGKKILALGNDAANQLAHQIHDAKSIFNDHEEAVYNAIGSLKNQAQVAELNLMMKNVYGMGLYQFLSSFMNTAERAKVWALIKNLPIGIL